MCCNFPTIKITEGNAFTLIFPLKRRSYVAERPIDEDIDVTRLTGVHVTLGGVEYAPTIETYGVRIDVPATLVRGTYDGLLTADYDGNAIRAAYESCVQIVAWNAQSNAQQYILGSPVSTKAAYILGYMPTDAEVEALKQQLREQIAAAEHAEAEAIAEKEQYAEALEHLDDIAQETSVEGIANSIGTPATGQPGTLFAAIAAGGGGGGGGGGTGDAREATSQAILAAVQSGNVTAIAELLNNAHGLDALRALIAAIPTTAPATPQNVTDAKDAVLAAIPSVSGLATEANATVNKQAVLDAVVAAEAALQGGDNAATLTALKQAVAAIVIPTDYAKETTAQQAASDAAAAKVAAQGITGYALQGSDPTATNTAILQAIPSVSGLATEANATNNKNEVLAAIAANAGIPTLTIPDSTASQELAPNVLYIFATRTSTLTLTIGTPIVGIANEYHFFIVCGSTAPTVNFPIGISWNGGSNPTIAADKTYEVSILNNVAAYFEV